MFAALKQGTRNAVGGSSGATRNVLVVAQVALSLVLLLGAGLLVRSFSEIMKQELGFDSNGLSTSYIQLPALRYAGPEQYISFFESLLENLTRHPGFEGVGIVNRLPATGGFNWYLKIQGRSWNEEEAPLAEIRSVSNNYFQVMRIPLLRGRSFTEADRTEARPIALINRELARQLFPENPIGQFINFRGEDGYKEIVGVVDEVRHSTLGCQRAKAGCLFSI